MMSPDPLDHIRRLREIFSAAAAASTGDNQPRFQRVSETFDTYAGAALYGGKSAKAAHAAFDDALLDLRAHVLRDEANYPIYVKMNNDAVRENIRFDDTVTAYRRQQAADAVTPAPRKRLPRRFHF